MRPKLAKTLKKENRKGTIPPPYQNISNHKPLAYQTHHNVMRDNVKHKTKILETKQADKLSHSTKQNRIGCTKGQEPLNTYKSLSQMQRGQQIRAVTNQHLSCHEC